MGGGGGGRLFEAGRLLTFSAFKMGAYSRWALIRGWALIRINTVMIAAIAEKVNKDQRDPCLTTSFTPVQFKVTVTPALPEPPISFSSKISS